MVSYFRPNDLRDSVFSILSNTQGPYHLSIIDNSAGGIDSTLNRLQEDASIIFGTSISVYRQPKNLGKGRAFMIWYNTIMKNSKSDHFVSIDSDIVVPPGWLTKMKSASLQVRQKQKLGILAPTIMNKPGEDFASQLAGRMNMHKITKDSHHFNHRVYSNRYTAGPMFLIDRQFFESAGGYIQTQLYGNDDGALCERAAAQKRFIGIVIDVEVLHLDKDVDIGYREWKKRNVNKDVDQRGYWDRI
jgi:GT2 family glycosyltransferase